MKRFIFPAAILLFLLIFIIAAPGKALAQVCATAAVAGLAVNPDYTMLNGGNVTVYCLHNGAYVTQTATTNNQGYFLVYYYGGSCVVGDHVWVTAGLGTLNGIEDAAVVQSNQIGLATVVIYVSEQDPQTPPAIDPPPVVPEFGLVTGILALVASAGSFKLLRRK